MKKILFKIFDYVFDVFNEWIELRLSGVETDVKVDTETGEIIGDLPNMPDIEKVKAKAQKLANLKK